MLETATTLTTTPSKEGELCALDAELKDFNYEDFNKMEKL